LANDLRLGVSVGGLLTNLTLPHARLTKM